MKNLPIFVKILLITIPLEVLILVSAFLLRSNMTDVERKAEDVYLNSLYEINNNLLAADRDFYQAEIAFTRYAKIAGAEATEVDDFNENAQQTIDKVTTAAKLAEGNELLYKVTLSDGEDFEAIYNKFVAAYNEWISAYNVSQKTGDYVLQTKYFKEARGYLDRLQEITEEWAVKEGEVLHGNINARINTLSLVYIVVIVLASVAVFVMAGNIANGIKTTKKRMDVIATNDLSEEIPATGAKDEIGQMTRSFKTMQENLREIISILYKESDELGASCEVMGSSTREAASSMDSINNAAGELATTATQTATDIENIASHMTNLDEVMNTSVLSTTALANASDEIGKVTKTGMGIVEHLTEVNNQCVSAFDTIFEGIENIEGSSSKISDASALISSIASQTNLLSLNASIEAARAGEAGKGFAVVAEEIRTLSDQSAESVNTINTLLEELQKNTREAMEQSDRVKEFVEKQNSSVNDTRGSFEDIITTVEEVNNAVEGIKEVNEEMARGFKEISSLIAGLSAASEENAATAEELSATSEMVTKNVNALTDIQDKMDVAANKLSDIVKKFKV
jgi:methyl-accepting chemotaxis protein